jgi:8-oxo-dGTP pyrophosphatase MutT (NUDIX family)
MTSVPEKEKHIAGSLAPLISDGVGQGLPRCHTSTLQATAQRSERPFRTKQGDFGIPEHIMSTDSKAIIQELQTVLNTLSQFPYPHVPNPEGCKKRASVAVIVRVRPPFKPVPASTSSVVDVEAETPSTSINDFFSKQWVQEGDPEVIFIKRAGRAGDRWSGHTALPGGMRDPEDADDCAAAIRETREEIGLDLDTSDCLRAGNLAERVIATTWGKESLMILCPYIFLLTSRTVPTLQPQPTEVASVHWVPLRALLSSSLRTLEYVDIASRMAKPGGPVAQLLLRLMMGKMMFSAVNLLPAESVYASSIPGFIPGETTTEQVSGWAQAPYGVPESSKSLAFQQPILLWGLTLGVLADFLDMLPPYNAVALWKYPTFTTPDLRFLVWLFTRKLRRDNAGDLSAGTYAGPGPSKSEEPAQVEQKRRRRRPSQTAMDATSQAVAVSEVEPAHLHNNVVGISGMGVGTPKHAVGHLLSGYYERINLSIAIFLAYRSVLGAGIMVWLYRVWQRRKASKL